MIMMNERAQDAMRELVNIASGNAASALAQLLGQRTMISVPRLTVARIDDIADLLDTGNEASAVVAMQMLGDVSGCLIFVMPLPRAHELSALLQGLGEPTSGDFDASGQSCLVETANILAGAYAGALGTVLGAIVMISVPSFGISPPENLLTRFRQSSSSELALCIETSFMCGGNDSQSAAHIVLLPSAGVLESIMTSL